MVPFPGKREHETVKIIVRKHRIIFLFLFVKILLLIFIPTAIMIALSAYGVISSTYLGISWAFFLVVVLYGLLITFVEWLNEELDTVIITDERIVNIDQISFLHRAIVETSLAHVSDVRGTQKGIWSDLFNYGVVELQTENSRVVSRIEYVGRPFKVAEKILQVRNEFFKKHSSVDELKSNEAIPPHAHENPHSQNQHPHSHPHPHSQNPHQQ